MANPFDIDSIQIENLEEEKPSFPFDPESIQIEDVPEEQVLEPEIKPEQPVQIIGDKELSAATSISALLMSLPRPLARSLLNILQRIKLLARPSNKSEYINYALNFEQNINEAYNILNSVSIDSATDAIIRENLRVLFEVAARAKQDVLNKYPQEVAQTAKEQEINIEPEKEQYIQQKKEEANLELSPEDKEFIKELLSRNKKEFNSQNELQKWGKIYFNLQNYKPEDKYLILLVDRYYGTEGVKRSNPAVRPLTGKYWTKEQREERLDELRAKEYGISTDEIKKIREEERQELSNIKELRMENPLGEYGAITTRQDFDALPEKDFEASESNFTSNNYLPENIPNNIKQLYNQMIEFYKITQAYFGGGFDEATSAREASSRIMEMIIPIIEGVKKYDPEFVEDVFADDMNLLLFSVMENLPESQEGIKTEPSTLDTPEFKDSSPESKKADADYIRNYARERANGIVTVFEPDPLNPKKLIRVKTKIPFLANLRKEINAKRAKERFDKIMSDPESAAKFKAARRLVAEKQFENVYGPEREFELSRKKPEEVHGLPTGHYKIKETEQEKLNSLLNEIDQRTDLDDEEKDAEKDRLRSRFYRDRLLRDLHRGEPLDPIALSKAKELAGLPKGRSLVPGDKEKILEHEKFAKLLEKAKLGTYSLQHNSTNRLQNIYTVPPGYRLDLAKDIILKSNELVEEYLSKIINEASENGFDPDKVEEVIRSEQRNYLLKHTVGKLNKAFPNVFSHKFIDQLKGLERAKDIINRMVYRILAAKQLIDDGKLKTAQERVKIRKNSLDWLNMFATVEDGQLMAFTA